MKRLFLRWLSVAMVLCLSLAFAPVALMEETVETQEEAVENAVIEAAGAQASEPTDEEAAGDTTAQFEEELFELDEEVAVDTVDEIEEEAPTADLDGEEAPTAESYIEEELDLDLGQSSIPMFEAAS